MATSRSVKLPARVTVQCPACGNIRTTLALHDNALSRARRCPECATKGEVVSVQPLQGAGCSCNS
ncbi:MAG TPA: hypothetical protein VHS54_08885 [Jatrophihabitans sp.]|nr:hypothetical protein [Jatrophihabitans sp.]